MRPGVSLDSARAAKPRAAEVYRALAGGDVAVAIIRLGDDAFGLKVNLTCEPAGTVHLPDEVEGVPVQVEVVGKIRRR